MRTEDAFHHLITRYPGGAVSLAPRLGKAASTLSHEINPPAGSSAKLGLRTAITIMDMSRDYGPLHALCGELGFMAVQLPVIADDGDDDVQAVAQRLADTAREFADVMGEASVAMADSRITDNELMRLQAQIGELFAATQSMLAGFTRINAKLHIGRGEV